MSYHHLVGDSRGTAGDKPEEGGDDVKSSWPLCPGLHTCYNAVVQSDATLRKEANRKKHGPVQIGRLQLASVKPESLVIAGQQHRGECVPEPCTHRPSSHEREGRPKSPRGAEDGLPDWD